MVVGTSSASKMSPAAIAATNTPGITDKVDRPTVCIVFPQCELVWTSWGTSSKNNPLIMQNQQIRQLANQGQNPAQSPSNSGGKPQPQYVANNLSVVETADTYNTDIIEYNMTQRQIIKEGIDFTGLLKQRAMNISHGWNRPITFTQIVRKEILTRVQLYPDNPYFKYLAEIPENKMDAKFFQDNATFIAETLVKQKEKLGGGYEHFTVPPF